LGKDKKDQAPPGSMFSNDLVEMMANLDVKEQPVLEE